LNAGVYACLKSVGGDELIQVERTFGAAVKLEPECQPTPQIPVALFSAKVFPNAVRRQRQRGFVELRDVFQVKSIQRHPSSADSNRSVNPNPQCGMKLALVFMLMTLFNYQFRLARRCRSYGVEGCDVRDAYTFRKGAPNVRADINSDSLGGGR